MAVTARSNWSAQLLINYITTEIRTLEPELQFARLGVHKDVPKGYNVLTFPQTNQLATTDVTTISTEGTNPTEITWGSTAYQASGTQYGINVKVSDLLVRNSAVEVIQSCVRQVKNALARKIDVAIQAIVNAGTNGVLYAGGKLSRATLAAGDLADQILLAKAVRNLRNSNVMPLVGASYAMVADASFYHDIMQNTAPGSWVDIARFASVNELLNGKLENFRGLRCLESANVQTFSSAITVHPATVVGSESFGWGYYQVPEPVLVMTPDSNNQLNLYSTIGAKADLGATLFEDTAPVQRVQRIEAAVSA